ncbi:PREDICTED: probable calcium-binding protein CML25 [Nelumbo nucifera]|uniref:EF-hand domain-containing protein n=2 Tax=Nelumbo nucifera TaxID=4432 RepID=A0A822Z731_NELNU|nr:PREDICTED: probable calcium-binding protein CML25 [Nelumbo nucifera]DAD40420.1 TPA_asm: hypothetical protein HUJ06_014743 [Nelumbo nucifera]
MGKVVDLDDNGFIDLNKFIDLKTNSVDSEKVVENLRHASMIFNVDANGSITLEELEKVLRSLGDDKCLIAEYKKNIHGVDSNGDGLVNFEEFISMMMDTHSPGSSSQITSLPTSRARASLHRAFVILYKDLHNSVPTYLDRSQSS